jgi:serine/threonine protein kinase
MYPFEFCTAPDLTRSFTSFSKRKTNEMASSITISTTLRHIKRLGDGAYGQVWKYNSEHSNCMVARKYFKCRKHADAEASWFQIIQSSFQQQQPNIIRMLRSTSTADGHPAIDLEFADEGTLYDLAFGDYEWTHCARLTSANQLRTLVAGCLQGVLFMHDAVGIIHNDIKPGNILMHRGIPKMGDLGMCSYKNSAMKHRIGTQKYVAPEVFAAAVNEEEGKTDIFSLGITFFEVFEGVVPTELSPEFRKAWRKWCADANEHEKNIQSLKLRDAASEFYKPQHFSARLMDGLNTQPGTLDRGVAMLVAEMIRINVSMRPTAAQCIEMLHESQPRSTKGVFAHVASAARTCSAVTSCASELPVGSVSYASRASLRAAIEFKDNYVVHEPSVTIYRRIAPQRIVIDSSSSSSSSISISITISSDSGVRGVEVDVDQMCARASPPSTIPKQQHLLLRRHARRYVFPPSLDQELESAATMRQPENELEQQTPKGRLLSLVRGFANGQFDDDVIQTPELAQLLAKLRVKSNCKANIDALQLLEVLFEHPEFEAKRQMLFETIVQTGKHWWHDHKKERAALRAKYENN